MPLGKRRHTPLTERDALLLDLDGVVYTGPGAIPHAVESITRAAETVRVGYITNNASRTDEAVAEHLSELGLSVAASDVVTSPQAAVRVLADLVEPGSRILVVGGDGLVSEVENAGFTVTRSAEDDPAAVIQGFAPAERERTVDQDDTIVLVEYRGHRLGMLLKAANLAQLERLRPGHPSIVTYNAEENRHMLAVNEALGFEPFVYEGAWRKDLA